MALSIFGYALGLFDLVALGFVAAAHVVLGWIYLLASALFLRAWMRQRRKTLLLRIKRLEQTMCVAAGLPVCIGRRTRDCRAARFPLISGMVRSGYFFRYTLAMIGAVALCGCFPSGSSQADEEKEPHFLAGKSLVRGWIIRERSRSSRRRWM